MEKYQDADFNTIEMKQKINWLVTELDKREEDKDISLLPIEEEDPMSLKAALTSN